MKKALFLAQIIYKNSPNKGKYIMTDGYTEFRAAALKLSVVEWKLWFEDMDKRMFMEHGVLRSVPIDTVVRMVPVL